MKNIENILDTLHLEDLNNDAHPSIFDENENYNMLIIRLPIIGAQENSKSFGFILTSSNSYYYDQEKSEFREFEDKFRTIYKMVDRSVDKVIRSFAKYQDLVSDLEENLYENNTDKDFLNSWLEIKLQILRVERMLLRTTNVIDEFISFHKDDEDFLINEFVDIHEHLDRIMRSALLQLSKLDYLYSFYNAKSNDKMNKMIYFLTIISAIFLPLNLMVGFFGMNTSGLPFSSGDNGTFFVVSIMLSLALGASVVFRFYKSRV